MQVKNYMKGSPGNPDTVKSVYSSYAAAIDEIGRTAERTAQKLGTTLDTKGLVTEYKGRLLHILEG